MIFEFFCFFPKLLKLNQDVNAFPNFPDLGNVRDFRLPMSNFWLLEKTTGADRDVRVFSDAHMHAKTTRASSFGIHHLKLMPI